MSISIAHYVRTKAVFRRALSDAGIDHDSPEAVDLWREHYKEIVEAGSEPQSVDVARLRKRSKP